MVIFWTLYIFPEGKNTLETKALKTIHNIDIQYGIAYFRILKKKRQMENSETSEISEISEILFRTFLFPIFRFCPRAKIENSDLKTSEKNFRDFWDFRGFRVFDLANTERYRQNQNCKFIKYTIFDNDLQNNFVVT